MSRTSKTVSFLSRKDARSLSVLGAYLKVVLNDRRIKILRLIRSRRMVVVPIFISFPFLIVIIPHLIIQNLPSTSPMHAAIFSSLISFGVWLDIRLYQEDAEKTLITTHLKSLPLSRFQRVVLLIFERVVSHPFLTAILILCVLACIQVTVIDSSALNFLLVMTLFSVNYVISALQASRVLQRQLTLLLIWLCNYLVFMEAPACSFLIIIVAAALSYFNSAEKRRGQLGASIEIVIISQSKCILIYLFGFLYGSLIVVFQNVFKHDHLALVLLLPTAYSLSNINEHLKTLSPLICHVKSGQKYFVRMSIPAIAISCLPVFVTYGAMMIKNELSYVTVAALIACTVAPAVAGRKALIASFIAVLIVFLEQF